MEVQEEERRRKGVEGREEKEKMEEDMEGRGEKIR